MKSNKREFEIGDIIVLNNGSVFRGEIFQILNIINNEYILQDLKGWGVLHLMTSWVDGFVKMNLHEVYSSAYGVQKLDFKKLVGKR